MIVPSSPAPIRRPARFCTKTPQGAPCLITTPEQLFVFARATAARDEDSGAIAVVMAAPRR